MNNDCAKIKAYRDNQLENDFRKAEKRLKLDREAKEDLYKIKKDLLNSSDGGVFSMNFVISRNGLVTAQLAGSLKMICEKLNDVLGFALPEAKGGAYAVKKVVDYTGYLIDTIKNGHVSTINAFEIAFKKIRPEGKVKIVQETVMMVWKFADNMKDIIHMEDEQKELIAEVKRQVENLDRAVQTYEKDINLTSKRLMMLEQIKENINQYIRGNCQPGGRTRSYVPALA
jgi:hypothetical protein